MLFDTNILIYADRGNEKAKNLILDAENRSISAVTYMEYVPFCQNRKELAIFHKLLEALHFSIIEIDTEISLIARQMVRQFALSHSMEMGDALIAATATTRSLQLCTSNIKHFRQVKSLQLKHFNV